MRTTVSHLLTAGDMAKAEEIATKIHRSAEIINRQTISRYGMDIFQDVKPPLHLTLDFMVILYTITDAFTYIQSFVNEDLRVTAFENQIALNVHLLTVQRGLPVLVMDVEYLPAFGG